MEGQKRERKKPERKADPGSGAAQKLDFKPGNMLYPLPAVMVSCGDESESNIITVAWAGTVCSDPPMISVSVKPERYSHHLIRESGEFVINLVTEELVRATDYCGVRSGRDTDKWADCGLTRIPSKTVRCPAIGESPVNIECRVKSVTPLGSHTMFVAEVTAVRADGRYLDEKGRFRLNDAKPVTYSHGTYFSLGKELGTFGFSVKKDKTKPRKAAEKRRKTT